jgi:signal transduction histidine kinase
VVSCDAAEVVRERVEFWSVLATETGRTADLDLATGPLPVRLSRSDLAACADALLGNVFAHTPDGTDFAIRLTGLPGGGARLVIADQGPGFPGPATGRLLRRGADASGGDLILGNAPGGGAQVTLDLGPPIASS